MPAKSLESLSPLYIAFYRCVKMYKRKNHIKGAEIYEGFWSTNLRREFLK